MASISNEEYLKAKQIVEQYEREEYEQGTLDAMYCVSCQAFNAHECFCEYLETCDCCGEKEGYHAVGCLREEADPHNLLLSDGYD